LDPSSYQIGYGAVSRALLSESPKKNEMKKLNARCIGAMIAVAHRRLRAFTGVA
jgi:hypothetical protein